MKIIHRPFLWAVALAVVVSLYIAVAWSFAVASHPQKPLHVHVKRKPSALLTQSYCLAVQCKQNEHASVRALLYSLIDALAFANQDGPHVNVTVVLADQEAPSAHYITDLRSDPFVMKAHEELPFTLLEADMSGFDRALYHTEAVADEGYTQLQYLLDKYFLYPDGGLATECHWAHFAKGETVFSPRFLREVFVHPKPVLGDAEHLEDPASIIDPKALADVVLFSFVGMHPAESRDALRRRHQVVHAKPKYGGVDLVSVMYRVKAVLRCADALSMFLPTDPEKAEVIRKQGLMNMDWHMFKRLRKGCQTSYHVLPGVLAFKQDKELAVKFPLSGRRSKSPRKPPSVCLAVHTTEAESVTTEALLANLIAMVEVTNPATEVNVELKVILADASTKYWGSGEVPAYLSRLASLAMLKKAKGRQGLTVHTPTTTWLEKGTIAETTDSDRRGRVSQLLLDHIKDGNTMCNYVMFIHEPRSRLNTHFLNETIVAPRPLRVVDSAQRTWNDTAAPAVHHSDLGDAILFDFITAQSRPSTHHDGKQRTALVQEAKMDAKGVDMASVMYRVSSLKMCDAVMFASSASDRPTEQESRPGWHFLTSLIEECNAAHSVLPSVLYAQ
eukprot:TRINITY_DN3071_c0_g1_i1.p1 TRINITY_DN3071_c0_g1~~TRINITY_DN3071_c0_g1_i1.p1  ORF type:complete len:615 (+),score=48.58 TRINITY_DN3071_c0_g1_i1:96-1940(+)